jgi:hypothetical protein
MPRPIEDPRVGWATQQIAIYIELVDILGVYVEPPLGHDLVAGASSICCRRGWSFVWGGEARATSGRLTGCCRVAIVYPLEGSLARHFD